MTFIEAAVEVIRINGHPMTSREIAEEVVRRGLVQTSGRTPERTMASCLYLAARDNPNSPLVRSAQPGKKRAKRGTVLWSLKK